MSTIVKEIDCPDCHEPIEVEVEETTEEQDLECPECDEPFIAVYDPATGTLTLTGATDSEDEEEDDEEEEGFVDPADEEEEEEQEG